MASKTSNNGSKTWISWRQIQLHKGIFLTWTFSVINSCFNYPSSWHTLLLKDNYSLHIWVVIPEYIHIRICVCLKKGRVWLFHTGNVSSHYSVFTHLYSTNVLSKCNFYCICRQIRMPGLCYRSALCVWLYYVILHYVGLDHIRLNEILVISMTFNDLSWEVISLRKKIKMWVWRYL